MKKKINCNWHKYVDLGLPSGLLWATCNIGAKEPWETGLYFSWGNVDGHKKGSGYRFGESNNGPYASTPGASLVGKIPVNAKYDAARANLGGSWRMPTTYEIMELRGNCTMKWTTQNDVNGRLFTSLINGHSVFFPASGYYHYFDSALHSEGMFGGYWSSLLNPHTYAYGLFFDRGNVFTKVSRLRFYGLTIRAVLDRPKDSLLIKTIKR